MCYKLLFIVAQCEIVQATKVELEGSLLLADELATQLTPNEGLADGGETVREFSHANRVHQGHVNLHLPDGAGGVSALPAPELCPVIPVMRRGLARRQIHHNIACWVGDNR